MEASPSCSRTYCTPKGIVAQCGGGVVQHSHPRKSVRRGSFETLRALIRQIERYLTDWNAHPTPFVWTKDPAAIINTSGS